jgi:aldehyde:ferredoxin oxidoreductase
LSGAAKFCAVFKSPLTGIWGESQCGGHFAPQPKRARYDIVIIQGRSNTPVYIIIEDENVEIRDAAHLWGKDTFETEDYQKGSRRKFSGSFHRACRGNLVRYACITHARGRQFGRCGAGAVMVSKG